MFVAQYLVEPNATKAAELAGYSAKTAYSIGQRLLKNVEVSAELEKRTQKLEDKLDISADYVLRGIRDTVEEARQVKEFGNALKGYELLGKHKKLFTEKYEHKLDISSLTDSQLDDLEAKLAASES